MTDSELLEVDAAKTAEPVQMTDPRATAEWPHHPGVSTPAEYLQPTLGIETPTAVISTTPDAEPANMHGDGPHFARTVDDHPELGTVCGQDGQPWPCAAWQGLTRPPDAEPAEETTTLAAVAEATGMTVEELRARLHTA